MSAGGLRIRPPRPSQAKDPLRRAASDARRLEFERLRDLVGKATLDPYSKEVAYAFPLAHGALPQPRVRGLRAVCAPLFLQAVAVAAERNGTIVVTPLDEPPRFNTALWQETVSEDQRKAIVEFGVEAQTDLAARFDPARISTLLEAIQSVLGFTSVGELDATVGPWPEILQRAQEPSLTVVSGAALFLANRSSQYLLHDLQAIAADPERFLAEGRPLSTLVSRPSTEKREELRSLREDEVVFPFASNEPQRRVVDALAKNNLVVVQGPPGTGKSQTIANLVAHLVAEGKRVLVTSHKQQALVVVRDKLEQTGLRFLFASLIGGDAEAKRSLRTQIGSVQKFAASAESAQLARQLSEVEQRRREAGERFAEADREFEFDASPTQSAAAELWEKIRLGPVLPLEDGPVPEEAQTAVTAGLVELDRLVRARPEEFGYLASREAAGSDLTRAATLLSEFVALQRTRLEVATDSRLKDIVALWQPKSASPDKNAASSALGATDRLAALLRGPIGELATLPQYSDAIRASAAALSITPELRDDARAALAEIDSLFQRARELNSFRGVVPAEPGRRAEIAHQHAVATGGGLLARGRARRWLTENSPGVLGQTTEAIAGWVAFWDAWEGVRTRIAALGGGLSEEIGALFDPDGVALCLRRARVAIAFSAAADEARSVCESSSFDLPLVTALEANSVPELDRELNTWRLALSALSADAEGGTVLSSAALRFSRPDLEQTDALVDRGQYEEALPLLEWLERVADALPDFSRANELLSRALPSVPASARALMAAALRGEPAPDFLADPTGALERHSLAHRFADLSRRPSTRTVAERAQALREQVTQDAARLLELRIQARIVEAFRKPSFLTSLEAFRKAMNASAKRFETFEALKTSDSVDPNVLTEAFPCWIMRPDDACRVFRLDPDTFDVVIFDEASQCNPDIALPLLARAERVVIFGDEKQLSNEDLRRSLSGAQNRVLRRQSGLEDRDPEGLFDETRYSLLELCARRLQAQVMLTEHFRCRPEIVAFANSQFYGSALTIIRDRGDDHGLGHPLLLREVVGVPPMGKSKVNEAEALALVADLSERLEDPAYASMSFGVLSLFREQIEFIESRVAREVSPAAIARHRLICATVDGFQGDERDVIYYSWRYGPDSRPGIFTFTSGGTGNQRVNVALTRARHQAIHFISAPVDAFPSGAPNVTGFLRHAENPAQKLDGIEATFFREPTSRTRLSARGALEAAGFSVAEDVPASGTCIDLVVGNPATGTRMALFCDAQAPENRPVDAPRRMQAHALLARAGWHVDRVPATEGLPSPTAAVERGTALLGEPTSSDRKEVPPLEPACLTIDTPLQGEPVPLDGFEIAPEDRADYHWDAPSVEVRLRAGAEVFMSDFEAELHDLLERAGLKVVPQWPSRGKFIDLVVTDRRGRRLAIEADGEPYHQTADGKVTAEDAHRQRFLEEAGWVFHRVAYDAWQRSNEAEINRVLEFLAGQPENDELAALVWGADAQLEEALELDDEDGPKSPSGGGRGAGVSELEPPEDSISVGRIPPVEPSAGQEDHDVAPSDVAATGRRRPTLFDTSGPAPARDGARPAREWGRAHPFERLDLGAIPVQISELVQERGFIDDSEVIEALSARLGISHVPRNYLRLLNGFLWSAKGRRFIEQRGSGWVPGPAVAAPHAILSGMTLDGLARQAGLLAVSVPSADTGDEELFQAMVDWIAPGSERVTKFVSRIIGASIALAERRGLI